MASFALNRLPPELRLEIWGLAVQANARRRLVIEQKFQVFPTLNLVASPFFSVNAESREVAMSFYPVRLAVYHRRPQYPGNDEHAGATAGADDDDDDGAEGMMPAPEDYRGMVYLSPALDVIISIYPWAKVHGPSDIKILGTHDRSFFFDRSVRSKMTAWHHRATAVSADTLRSFRRHPDRWCLMRYAAGRLGVQDWMAVHEWLLGFGEEEYRNVIGLLRSMRLNSREFAQVFGWE